MRKVCIGLLPVVVLIIAAAFAYGPANTDAKAANNAYIVYEDPTYGFKAEYPATWRTLEDVRRAAVVFHSPLESSEDKYSENVNVMVEDMTGHPTVTVDGYAELGLAKLPSYIADFNLIGSRKYTLSGQPARIIEYTGRQGEYHIHIFQVMTIANNNAYIVTLVAEEANYARYFPVGKRIIDSFVIK